MEHFPILILNGRPGSGKSEIFDFLEKLDPSERLRRFHIAEPDLLDDFPMLWAWFEEDHILANVLDKARLHTDSDGYFKHVYLWDLLIERLSLEYRKHVRDRPDYHERCTAVIEFSRGSEHGGYQQAYAHLAEDLLGQAAALYVRVSYRESLRKNRLRFNPERPDSVLEHSLPDEKLERLYKDDDWDEYSSYDPKFLCMGNLRLPYAVFENEDDLTTNPGEALAERLEDVLSGLWITRSVDLV